MSSYVNTLCKEEAAVSGGFLLAKFLKLQETIILALTGHFYFGMTETIILLAISQTIWYNAQIY